MSLTKIFAVNLGLGLLASVAHIGALVLFLNDVPGVSITSLHILIQFIAIELIVVISAVFALAGDGAWTKRALLIHGVIFGLVAALTFFWVLQPLFFGIPEGNFFLTPGFSAALVGYGASVARRAFYQGKNRHILNAGWYAAGITLFLELLLMYRFYVEQIT